MSEATDKIREWMAANGVTLAYEFVPFSQSRNAKPNPKISDLSLNWKVTVRKGERELLKTDYMSGIGHAPAHKKHGVQRYPSSDGAEAIRYECEKGFAARKVASTAVIFKGGVILPNDCDVLASLAMDSDALDYAKFEDWARDLGYDPDSRKAESIYKACMEITLSLRNGLGEAGLTSLHEAASGY